MDYETLAMEEIIVEMENGFLEASKPAKISQDSEIVVEEFKEIDNTVTFD